MTGASVARGVQLAARTSADSTVAYGYRNDIKPQMTHMTTQTVPVLLKRIEELKAQGAAYASQEREYHAELGVMHQHRYQAYEALGDKEKAQADQEFASRLGYDPAKHGL